MTESRRREPLLQKMMQRYFAIPEVKSWLMYRQPRSPKSMATFENPLSYACMYYPPSYVPRGVERYPLPKPFLDIGDVLLCHHVYDGIAVGTLHNKNEKHAIAVVRDSLLKNSNYRLSSTPRTRNFAVDLRVKQLEAVEFAWMDDNSLIIACRRLVQSPTEEGKLLLSADFLAYECLPPPFFLQERFLVLKMSVDERTVVCDFCGIQGYQSCECLNSMKREAPQSYMIQPSSNALSIDQCSEPTGPFASAIGSWHNYTNAIFRCAQTGSFFFNSMRRASNGKMMPFPGPKNPIQYRFICGQRHDTQSLVSLYLQKTGVQQRSFIADTYLYGNGLSRGSHIGMLMDKHNHSSFRNHAFQSHEYNHTLSSFSHDDTILPIDISHHVATGTVPSQSTLSNDTLPGSEYSRLYSQYDVTAHVIPDQSQCTEEGSLFNTRPNEESPSSILLDREEAWMGRLVEIPEIPADSVRHPINVANNEWTEADQDAQPIHHDQPTPQPRPLSTSNHEIQECMTVDASGTPTCRICKASFPKRGNLSRHIQTVHFKLKPFFCKHCPARFGYNAHLKRHNKSVHQRVRNFRG